MSDLFPYEYASPDLLPTGDQLPSPTHHDVEGLRISLKIDYAPGLDRFFETNWYSTQAEFYLQPNDATTRYFYHCTSRFRKQPTSQTDLHTDFPSLEARLLWDLAVLPRKVALPDASVSELINRVATIESLLTGAILPSNKIPGHPPHAPPQPHDEPAHSHYVQSQFWHHLAAFTSCDDSPRSANPQSAMQSIMHSLYVMRGILSLLENRDVLYSIAVLRHYGGRMKEAYPEKERVLVAESQDPEDSLNKLSVAMSFLASEEVHGTTLAVQRFTGMSRRSWWRGRPDFKATNGEVAGAAGGRIEDKNRSA